MTEKHTTINLDIPATAEERLRAKGEHDPVARWMVAFADMSAQRDKHKAHVGDLEAALREARPAVAYFASRMRDGYPDGDAMLYRRVLARIDAALSAASGEASGEVVWDGAALQHGRHAPSEVPNADLARQIAEHAGIDALDDYDLFIAEMSDALNAARAEGIAAEQERIEHACEMIAVDWRDDGQEQKWLAFQYLRDNAIRGAKPVNAAATDVLAERERQKSAEGWTEAHDDEHDNGELAAAAACYAAPVRAFRAEEVVGRDYEPFTTYRDLWPWADQWWKPKDRRRDLVRAGALILAEIERLDRTGAEP